MSPASSPPERYRGRFAPSPTGPLHFGSLAAALASFADARAAGGDWLLRIEDLDTPRNRPGALDAILHTLDRSTLRWDGPVVVQSERREVYFAVLDRLRREGLLYPCTCSRREIADSSLRASVGGAARYPGLCRERSWSGTFARPPAWRLRTDARAIGFEDRVRGRFATGNLEASAGDFILRRADGVIAYQLAVVVDDAAFGITDVVRGADLLDSTFRQIYLQQTLSLPTPLYLHVPTATNARGEKLSKQTRAVPVDPERPAPALRAALEFLGQRPPASLRNAEPGDLIDWAVAHWRVAAIPAVDARSAAHDPVH